MMMKTMKMKMKAKPKRRCSIFQIWITISSFLIISKSEMMLVFLSNLRNSVADISCSQGISFFFHIFSPDLQCPLQKETNVENTGLP